eukprot:s1260_g11.t1
MADPWRCKRCWKVASGKHTHCPHCGGRWDRVQDLSFVPKGRSSSQRAQGRDREQTTRDVQWKQDTNPKDQESTSRGRSESAKKRRGRGRGRKNPAQEEDGLPSYTAPAMPPPWRASEGFGREVPAPAEMADMTAEERAEVISALRTAYPNQSEMPANIKKLVDKYDVQTTQQLTKNMHRTTDSIKKARQMLHKLQDAKINHRKSWLRHLSTLMETLGKQIEAFENQQKDYQDRIQTSRKELQTSRRSLQRLNVQAAEAAIPEAVIEEEDQPEPQQQDAEESELRSQVNVLLRKCIKATANKEMIEILSEAEEDGVDMVGPLVKRPRSREPGDGGSL